MPDQPQGTVDTCLESTKPWRLLKCTLRCLANNLSAPPVHSGRVKAVQQPVRAHLVINCFWRSSMHCTLRPLSHLKWTWHKTEKKINFRFRRRSVRISSSQRSLAHMWNETLKQLKSRGPRRDVTWEWSHCCSRCAGHPCERKQPQKTRHHVNTSSAIR